MSCLGYLLSAAFVHTLLHSKEGCSDAIENLSWYATCFSMALASAIHCDSHSLPSPKAICELGKLTWILPELPLYCKMTQSPYHDNFISHPKDPATWENNLQYAPSPGYFSSPNATGFNYSPSPSVVLEDQSQSDILRLLQLSEWKEGRVYNKDMLTCIYYHIEWRVTVNNQEVSKDMEEDLVLAPSAFWQLSLEKKLEKVLR